MVRAAWNSLEDADAVVFLVDANAKLDEKITAIVDELGKRKQRVILALNKVDKLNPNKLLPLAKLS